MTAVSDPSTERRVDASTTWVERQHERLEAESDTAPAHLQLEDGVGAVFGGAIGLVVGLVLGAGVLALAVPVEVGTAVVLLLVAGGLGVLVGAIVGGVTVGVRAHEAEAEFADLWAHAREEEPVHLARGVAPLPVEPGESVFDETLRS